MLWVRLAIKEILNQRRFSLFFVLNFALGLIGFIVLDSFKYSVLDSVSDKSRDLLTAELAISARRPFSESELKTLDGILGEYPSYHTMRLFSMVAKPGGASRLVELLTIEAEYPFFGRLELEQAGVVNKPEAKGSFLTKPQVWIYPELKTQLGVELGDTLKVGDLTVTVADSVVDDPGGMVGMNVAPRVYLAKDQLAATNLIRPGSLVTHTYYYVVGEASDELATQLRETLKDPALRVITHLNNSQNVSRMSQMLSDYLGLIALISLFLSAIGGAYLFRSHLQKHFFEVGVLMVLGASPRQARAVYLIQLAVLGGVAATLTVVVGFGLIPLLNEVLKSFVPTELEPMLYWKSIVLCYLMAIFGSFLTCLPVLLQTRDYKASQLLQEQEEMQSSSKVNLGRSSVLALLPASVLYYGLSVWQANSFIVGGLFFVMILVSALVLSLVSLAVLKVLNFTRGSLAFRIATRSLVRARLSSMSVVVAIGVSSVLLNVVLHVRESIMTELDQPDSMPSFFFFDIQPEQVEPLAALLTREDSKLDYLTPFVRARLIKINGEDFKKYNPDATTREEQTENWQRNRQQNVTYRAKLTSSETIVDGQPYSGAYDWDKGGDAELSVEVRYARRLGLKVGDRLDFEVQGIPVTARVVNLRKIKWTSFTPNFFFQFQDGLLNDAPKTFLASAPRMGTEQKLTTQAKIVERFPNISMVDVERVVDKILEIILQMSFAIQLMALLALATALAVVYCLAQQQASERQRESNLLKILGANQALIGRTVLWEFGILSGLAGAMGALIGVVASYVFAVYLFNRTWVFEALIPVGSTVLIALVATGVAYVSMGAVLRRKPVL